MAAGLLWRAETQHLIRAEGLACPRNVVRLYRGCPRRFPADGSAELDRQAAAAGQAADAAVLDVGCGTGCRQQFSLDRLGSGCGDRQPVPHPACRRRSTRDHRGQEVGQSQDRRHHRPVRGRQYCVSSRGARFGPCGIRQPRRNRHGDRSDFADWRADHSELYPELAGQTAAGQDAVAVRPLRCRGR